MIEAKQGAIVNVASMAGITGRYDAHADTAAKGVIVNLSRSIGITYIKQGIRRAGARAPLISCRRGHRRDRI